jgi:hypothetical protein
MADHELEIKFTGDWSGLRSQAERQEAVVVALALQSRRWWFGSAVRPVAPVRHGRIS